MRCTTSLSILMLALGAAAFSNHDAWAAPPAAEQEWLGVATQAPPEKSPVDLKVKGRERYQYEHGRWWYRMPGCQKSRSPFTSPSTRRTRITNWLW